MRRRQVRGGADVKHGLPVARFCIGRVGCLVSCRLIGCGCWSGVVGWRWCLGSGGRWSLRLLPSSCGEGPGFACLVGVFVAVLGSAGRFACCARWWVWRWWRHCWWCHRPRRPRHRWGMDIRVWVGGRGRYGSRRRGWRVACRRWIPVLGRWRHVRCRGLLTRRWIWMLPLLRYGRVGCRLVGCRWRCPARPVRVPRRMFRRGLWFGLPVMI